MFDQIKVQLLNSWQGPRGGDGTVAHAAWASTFDAEKLSSKSDEDIRRVVTNVVDHHHDTPKERLWLEFFITCPIFIERQYDKYRMTVQHQDFQVEFLQRPMGGDHITQNELSGRYRTIPERTYTTPADVGAILKKVAAAGYTGVSANLVDEKLQEEWNFYKDVLNKMRDAEKHGHISNAEYKRAREVIRGVLGTSFLTDMRITMNLNAFEHIVNQRIDPSAQPEGNIVAHGMVSEALNKGVAPIAIEKLIAANNWQTQLDRVDRLMVHDF